jgi:hypothetical protein
MTSEVTFQYFTYFLNPLEQSPLFVDSRDKNDIFRELLQKGKFTYKSNGVQLAFVTVKEQNGYFICKLGKKATIKRHLPPDENFEETVEESWPFATVIINTNPNNGKGQKIVFELKSNVFPSPQEQIKNLQDELNTFLLSSGYAIAINPVTEVREFWHVVDENEGKIEKLTFSYNAPNLFGIKDSLNNELKNLEKDYNSNRISIELENSAGLLKVPKNDLTNQSVEYITKGGGEYSLKIKGKVKKVLKSKDSIVTKSFDIDITTEGHGQQAIFDVLAKIFE